MSNNRSIAEPLSVRFCDAHELGVASCRFLILTPDCSEVITFKDIEAARERIAGAVYYSPCLPSIPLSELTGIEIFCKLDNLQRTGSFKDAAHAMRSLNCRRSSKSAGSSPLLQVITLKHSLTRAACSAFLLQS